MVSWYNVDIAALIEECDDKAWLEDMIQMATDRLEGLQKPRISLCLREGKLCDIEICPNEATAFYRRILPDTNKEAGVLHKYCDEHIGPYLNFEPKIRPYSSPVERSIKDMKVETEEEPSGFSFAGPYIYKTVVGTNIRIWSAANSYKEMKCYRCDKHLGFTSWDGEYSIDDCLYCDKCKDNDVNDRDNRELEHEFKKVLAKS